MTQIFLNLHHFTSLTETHSHFWVMEEKLHGTMFLQKQRLTYLYWKQMVINFQPFLDLFVVAVQSSNPAIFFFFFGEEEKWRNLL